jgi:hypothetical protein
VTWKPEYVLLGVLCGALVALTVLLARGESTRLGRRSSFAGAVGAVAIAPLGFLPLWAIVASIHETLKVYLLSSIAVAAGAGLLIGFLCRTRTLVAVVGGALVSLAAIYGLHQHAHFVGLAHGETRVLGEMVEQLPAPADGTTIVVRDSSGKLSQVWTLGPPVTFGAAVEVAYHNPTLRIILCDEAHGHAYSNGVLLPSCPLGERARLAVFDYDLVHELRLLPQGSLGRGYAPLRLADKGPSLRSALFGCSPIQGCTDAPSASWPRGAVHETFDAEPDNLTGFRPAEKAPDGTSFRWSDSAETHVFAFLPARSATFDLSVLFTVDPAVLQTIRVSVNGHDVPAQVVPKPGRYVVRATIPAQALAPSPDDLEIRSRAVPVAGSPDPLGLAVSRLDVTPQAARG